MTILKLRMKSWQRHYICLKPRKQNKEDLILHNRITNDAWIYLTIKSKGTVSSLFFPPCATL